MAATLPFETRWSRDASTYVTVGTTTIGSAPGPIFMMVIQLEPAPSRRSLALRPNAERRDRIDPRAPRQGRRASLPNGTRCVPSGSRTGRQLWIPQREPRPASRARSFLHSWMVSITRRETIGSSGIQRREDTTGHGLPCLRACEAASQGVARYTFVVGLRPFPAKAGALLA
jgi:hypothetical protein